MAVIAEHTISHKKKIIKPIGVLWFRRFEKNYTSS